MPRHVAYAQMLILHVVFVIIFCCFFLVCVFVFYCYVMLLFSCCFILLNCAASGLTAAHALACYTPTHAPSPSNTPVCASVQLIPDKTPTPNGV